MADAAFRNNSIVDKTADTAAPSESSESGRSMVLELIDSWPTLQQTARLFTFTPVRGDDSYAAVDARNAPPASLAVAKVGAEYALAFLTVAETKSLRESLHKSIETYNSDINNVCTVLFLPLSCL